MQLNLCQIVRQNTLYSAPARRENIDKLQNREEEGIGKRDGQVWGRKLSCCCSILRDVWLYLEVSPEIWSMPSWAFSPSFSHFPSIPWLIIPTFIFILYFFTRSLRVRISNARASAASLLVCLFYISLLLFLLAVRCSSVWNVSAKSWRESICPSLPLSLSLILTCVSSSAQRPPVSLPVSLLPLLRKRSS